MREENGYPLLNQNRPHHWTTGCFHLSTHQSSASTDQASLWDCVELNQEPPYYPAIVTNERNLLDYAGWYGVSG